MPSVVNNTIWFALFLQNVLNRGSTVLNEFSQPFQVEDIIFLVRKHPRMYARVKDLLTMNEELKKARKAFDEVKYVQGSTWGLQKVLSHWQVPRAWTFLRKCVKNWETESAFSTVEPLTLKSITIKILFCIPSFRFF